MPGPIPRFEDVDPRTLHLPPGMFGGVNLVKFTRQFSRYGLSTAGMDPPEVHEDPDGRLMIMNGVTRSTRVARFMPGQMITVLVTGSVPYPVVSFPTVADRLP